MIPPPPSAIRTEDQFSMLDQFVLKYGERGFLGLMDQRLFLEVRRADFRTHGWLSDRPTAIPESERPAWSKALREALYKGFPLGVAYNVPVTGRLVDAAQMDGPLFEWI